MGCIDQDLLLRLSSRSASRPGDRGPLRIECPWTGALLGEVPAGTPEDVVRAVTRLRSAQRAWVQVSPAEQARVVLRFHDLLLERQREGLDLLQLETGKARQHAFDEVVDCALVARYYARSATRYLRPRRRRGAVPLLTRTWERRQPWGVVGIIAPWNYPLTLAVSDAIPALLAGNAVLLKPASQTPFSALWAVDLLVQAGLPPDLVQVVTGAGAELGPAVVGHVDYVTFTGSSTTGRQIARQAAERLIGCTLELGGNNAMLVLDDANLGHAVDGAVRGAFTNAGQVCLAIQRIYVQAGVYDAFVRRFVSRTRALRLGASLDYGPDIGSLISADHLAKVTALVQGAVQAGAQLLAGGRSRPDLGPCFFEPTILANVPDDTPLATEEVFGPVVSVHQVASIEEAVERANRSPYGLNASIWTQDARRGQAIAADLQAGMVNINESLAAAWASTDAPAGGFKASGLGRRHGAEGILSYSQAQTIAHQRVRPLIPPGGRANTVVSMLVTGVLRARRFIPRLPR